MGESCWAFCYNHFILIHNIYPTNKSSEAINNSSLSLLIFYANSKPQKLPKIGLVLENKGLNDLSRNRMAYVLLMVIVRRVSILLHILDALIKDCSQDLNLFANSVLKIVLQVLDSNMIKMHERATQTVIVVI